MDWGSIWWLLTRKILSRRRDSNVIYSALPSSRQLDCIVLLAPAGIQRRMPDAYKSIFFRLHSIVPRTHLRTLVGKLIGVNQSTPPNALEHRQVKDDNGTGLPQSRGKSGKETLDVGAIVQWQFDHHKGFVHSFISTVVYGPYMHQQSHWRKVSDIIKGEDAMIPMPSRPSRLYNSRILVIFGDADGIVA